jgi:hypothetical protein
MRAVASDGSALDISDAVPCLKGKTMDTYKARVNKGSAVSLSSGKVLPRTWNQEFS